MCIYSFFQRNTLETLAIARLFKQDALRPLQITIKAPQYYEGGNKIVIQ